MIEIKYINSKDCNDNASVAFGDEATVSEVLFGLIRICKFAGYSEKSFDYIVKEANNAKIDDVYSFENYLEDVNFERRG